MSVTQVGNCVTLLFAVTTAVEGLLRLGPLAQSTLMLTAVLRRLSGK
jgi:hypothetical protein